eukprot:6117502-Prymnesium_polylepis.1
MGRRGCPWCQRMQPCCERAIKGSTRRACNPVSYFLGRQGRQAAASTRQPVKPVTPRVLLLG